MNNRFYRPELDVVRFVAFLSVFFHHIAPRFQYGHDTKTSTLADAAAFGLPLFFVLSAYLITTLQLREKQRTGTIAIRRFYQRRMLRIWPLYFGALSTGVLVALIHGHFRYEWRWYLAASLMLGNTNRIASVFIQLWSISVEEQFYLVWPGLMRKVSTGQLVLAATFMIAVANGVLIHYGNVHSIADDHAWYNSFVQFEMFAAGILLAIATFNQASWLSSLFARLTLATGVLATLVATEYFFHIKTENYPAEGPASLCMGYALIASSCAFFIYSMLGSQGWPKWVVHMGKVSYGLYVFHFPAIFFVNRVAPTAQPWFRNTGAFLITTILALLSYRFFETPFLKMKERLEVIPSRPVEID